MHTRSNAAILARTTPARRRWPAFVLASALLHGVVLASLTVIPIARGGSDAQDAAPDEGPECLIQLRVRPASLLATAELEPLAEPEPAAPGIEVAAAPAPEPAPAPPMAAELPANDAPEIEPEPSPEPLPRVEAPPVAVDPVVTTTAEEATAAAEAAPVEPPAAQTAPRPASSEEAQPVAPPAATPVAPAPAAPAPASPASNPGSGSSAGSGSGNAPAAPAAGSPAAPGGNRADSGALGLGALDDGFHLRALRSDRPEYPEEARRRNEEGSVTCRLAIDREGRVVEVVVVVSSGSAALDRAAVRALKRWRFESLAKITDRERVHAVQKLSFELHARRN